jgi:hypothetical protein
MFELVSRAQATQIDMLLTTRFYNVNSSHRNSGITDIHFKGTKKQSTQASTITHVVQISEQIHGLTEPKIKGKSITSSANVFLGY